MMIGVTWRWIVPKMDILYPSKEEDKTRSDSQWNCNKQIKIECGVMNQTIFIYWIECNSCNYAYK